MMTRKRRAKTKRRADRLTGAPEAESILNSESILSETLRLRYTLVTGQSRRRCVIRTMSYRSARHLRCAQPATRNHGPVLGGVKAPRYVPFRRGFGLDADCAQGVVGICRRLPVGPASR